MPSVLAKTYDANNAALSEDPLATVTKCLIFFLFIKLPTLLYSFLSLVLKFSIVYYTSKAS